MRRAFIKKVALAAAIVLALGILLVVVGGPLGQSAADRTLYARQYMDTSEYQGISERIKSLCDLLGSLLTLLGGAGLIASAALHAGTLPLDEREEKRPFMEALAVEESTDEDSL